MNFKQINRFGKNTVLFYIVFFVAIIVVILGGAYAFAKYISTFSSANKEVGVAKFYFVTDVAENSESTPYPIYDGKIRFNVKNNDGLNISSRNIFYTVTVFLKVGDSRSQVQSFSDTLVAAEDVGVTPHNAENSTVITVSDGDYIVEVSSTAPYAKTITLYFRVNTHYADSFFTVTGHDGWMLLDLYTGEDSSAITVSYGLFQPDNTSDLMSDWEIGTPGISTLDGLAAYSHYQLIFFGNYDVASNNPFELSQSGKNLVQSGVAITAVPKGLPNELVKF